MKKFLTFAEWLDQQKDQNEKWQPKVRLNDYTASDIARIVGNDPEWAAFEHEEKPQEIDDYMRYFLDRQIGSLGFYDGVGNAWNEYLKSF